MSLALLCGTFVSGAALAQDDSEDEARREDTIVVTGSYLGRQTQDELASPTLTISDQILEASGMTNLEDALLLNTANIGSVGGAQDLAAGGADDRATRSANLRGLGVQSTLVLLNGKRVANTDGYTNLVGLTPAISVERIETVLDGASAIYGSDAIAGVMNIITKKDFEGLALSGQYNHIADAPGYTIQGMIGGSGERFKGVLSFSHEYQDKLQGFNRDVTNFDNTSGLSQPGSYILRSRPVAAGGGDVIIDNGVSGPINYSQLYDQISAANGTTTVQFADPYCTAPETGGIYAGTSPFPNGSCRFSYQQRNPVKPRANITLVHADANYDLTENHELYFEGRYHQQNTERFGIASFPITTGSLTVPESNPYNPFGVDTTFSGRLLGNQSPDRIEKVELDAIHLVGGARGPLFGLDDWEYNVFGAYSREDFVLKTSDTDLISAQNALNGFGGADCQVSPFGTPSTTEVPGEGNCVYFSPFGADQNQSDPRAMYNVLTPYQRGEAGALRYIEGVVTGDLFELAGGTAGLALGAQVREEKQETFVDSSIINARFGFVGQSSPGLGERQVESLFSELYLPVLDNVDVQLAVRHEDYGSFTTTDPKVAINWRPNDWVALRGSYSTAFRAPDI
ncbi:MAG: TonB-dependent receptor, partial [Roseibium sp.]